MKDTKKVALISFITLVIYFVLRYIGIDIYPVFASSIDYIIIPVSKHIILPISSFCYHYIIAPASSFCYYYIILPASSFCYHYIILNIFSFTKFLFWEKLSITLTIGSTILGIPFLIILCSNNGESENTFNKLGKKDNQDDNIKQKK